MDHMDHIDHMDRMVHMDTWILGCWTWILGVWICILDIWTCICASGLVFWVSTHHPVVYVRAAGAFFFWKMTPPGFLSTYIVNLCDFHGFEAPLVKFSKSGQSVQMTMPARRASKFSAKRRALLPEVFFQSLISQTIPGFCEPWSECQPEWHERASVKFSTAWSLAGG